MRVICLTLHPCMLLFFSANESCWVSCWARREGASGRLGNALEDLGDGGAELSQRDLPVTVPVQDLEGLGCPPPRQKAFQVRLQNVFPAGQHSMWPWQGARLSEHSKQYQQHQSDVHKARHKDHIHQDIRLCSLQNRFAGKYLKVLCLLP